MADDLVELLTPTLMVTQVLDDLPLSIARFSFGLRGVFEKEGFHSFHARLHHIRHRFGQRTQAYGRDKFVTPIHNDTLTGEHCAWFLSQERPLIVDGALNLVPQSVQITRGSRVIVATVVHLVRPQTLGFLPRAIQILHLEAPSDPEVPFVRLAGAYRYVNEGQSP
ncbi:MULTISPECIES: hypothetical protein [Rhodopseudomonas]|uniref:hypothetical protein n=1 Tax=Rhodopseudomonas TaxID=1073 RepID=UPI0012D3E1E2|nr:MULTISPECIES: hypothetical protein [Rhodopseudomonas]